MRLIRLLAVVALASVSALSVASKSFAAGSSSARTALLVSNAAYADGDAELTTPVADAEKLAEALKRLGFQTQVEKNLRKKPMDDAVESFINRAEPGSVAVFFFAGYGIQAGGKNYLIPIDPRIWSEADLLREGVSVEDIQAKLGERGVKARIVILEAARRNPFERRFRSVSSGLAPSPSAPGLIRFYAAANTALGDPPAATNSVFVSELARQLTPDRQAAQAFQAARDEISRLTNNQQIPYITVGLSEPLWLDASEKATAPTADPPKPKIEPEAKRVEPAPLPQAPAIKEYASSDATRKAELDARIIRNPGDEASISERGQILALHRDYKAALADFDESTRLNSSNVKSWNNRCWVRAILNDLEKALDDCNEALRRRPKFADALDSRALVYLKQGNADAAYADYSEALKINPTHASALYGRGIAQSRLGRRDNALDDMAKAKRLDPSIEREFGDYGVK